VFLLFLAFESTKMARLIQANVYSYKTIGQKTSLRPINRLPSGGKYWDILDDISAIRQISS
jgi:hypothetical protein